MHHLNRLGLLVDRTIFPVQSLLNACVNCTGFSKCLKHVFVIQYLVTLYRFVKAMAIEVGDSAAARTLMILGRLVMTLLQQACEHFKGGLNVTICCAAFVRISNGHFYLISELGARSQ
jgi:hypothetical protein